MPHSLTCMATKVLGILVVAYAVIPVAASFNSIKIHQNGIGPIIELNVNETDSILVQI